MKNAFLRRTLWVAIIGTLLVSMVPNIFTNYWFLDIFSSFKLQYLVFAIGLILLAVLVLKKKIFAIGILVLSILWNGYYIAPYYMPANTIESSKEDTLKISSINLLSSNTKTELVTKYIQKEDPDILILMEFTHDWESKLHPIFDTYSYKKLVPRKDNFGIALLSKMEMKSSVDYFNLNDKPSIIGDISFVTKKFTVIATHPLPPMSQKRFENRNTQLRNIVDKRSTFSENRIIMGDFNISSFSNHFNTLLQGDLKDSRIGFGLLPTWPAGYNMLQTTIDHCLVSSNINVIERTKGEYIGSDHLPINIVIGIN